MQNDTHDLTVFLHFGDPREYKLCVNKLVKLTLTVYEWTKYWNSETLDIGPFEVGKY